MYELCIQEIPRVCVNVRSSRLFPLLVCRSGLLLIVVSNNFSVVEGLVFRRLRDMHCFRSISHVSQVSTDKGCTTYFFFGERGREDVASVVSSKGLLPASSMGFGNLLSPAMDILCATIVTAGRVVDLRGSVDGAAFVFFVALYRLWVYN